MMLLMASRKGATVCFPEALWLEFAAAATQEQENHEALAKTMPTKTQKQANPNP